MESRLLMTLEKHDAITASHLLLAQPDPAASLDAAEVGLWQWRPDDAALLCCARFRSICGLASDAPVTLDSLLARIHPADRERIASALQLALADGQPCSIECRTLEGGRERWIAIEGRRRFERGALPSVAGVVMDITARKQRALQSELLMRDMSHRISNAFAVLSAVVHLSSRNARTPEELSRVLQARITALARAYAVATDDKDVALRSIVERELAPFLDLARVTVSGEPTWLPPRFAISMTLILHELATNAMKHGALRRADGELFIGWWSQADRRAPRTILHWKERCGEPIAPPGRSGLGSSLLSMSAGNVDGDIRMEFQPDGLVATVILPCAGTPR